MELSDNDLLRYSRQIMLPQLDIDGQQRLLASRVLIIGLGGLGSPAAMYLAASGIGELALSDFDKVDLSNLQRQIIHETANIGMDKLESAKRALLRLNPEVRVTELQGHLDGSRLLEEVGASTVVLDCSDNFATRFAVNAACVKSKVPLVSGAVIRFEGQISVFTPGLSDSPCYNCLYAEQGESEESCVRNGVIAPLPGIVGSMQALETIKLIAQIGEPLRGRLLILDALRMEWSQIRLRRNPVCPTCGGIFPAPG